MAAFSSRCITSIAVDSLHHEKVTLTTLHLAGAFLAEDFSFQRACYFGKKMTHHRLRMREMSKKPNRWETVSSPWDKALELPKVEKSSVLFGSESKLIPPRWIAKFPA